MVHLDIYRENLFKIIAVRCVVLVVLFVQKITTFVHLKWLGSLLVKKRCDAAHCELLSGTLRKNINFDAAH